MFIGHRLAARQGRRRAAFWIGVLFAVGSVCFVIGPMPGFVQLTGSALDGAVFFAGSAFFTAAAFLQLLALGSRGRLQLSFQPHSSDWWSAVVQLAGTVFFNVSTFRAMQQTFDTSDVDRLVWAPEAVGSICFLISGLLAYLAVRGGGLRHASHTPTWKVATVNLAGCILFGISAIAGYVVPATGDVLALAPANLTTSLGAVCFLTGALIVVRQAPPQPNAAA